MQQEPQRARLDTATDFVAWLRFPITHGDFLAWLRSRADEPVAGFCHCPVEAAVRALTGDESFGLLRYLSRRRLPEWVAVAVNKIDLSVSDSKAGWSKLIGNDVLRLLAATED